MTMWNRNFLPHFIFWQISARFMSYAELCPNLCFKDPVSDFCTVLFASGNICLHISKVNVPLFVFNLVALHSYLK